MPKRTSLRIGLAVLALLAGTACGGVVAVAASNRAEPTNPGTTTVGTTTADTRLMGLDQPLADGVLYETLEEAQRHLSFTPVIPTVGTLRSIFVSAVDDVSLRSLGLVYDDAAFGRFVVTEDPTTYTQDMLENLATTCRPENGCGGSWTIIALTDQTRALQIASSVSSAVLWLRNGVLLNVYGPSETFSPEDAQVVANSFS